MFRLVAMIFVVTNGVPADQPSSVIQNKRIFTSEETCMEFLQSDVGKASMERFHQTILDQKGKVIAKFACAEIEIKSDDGKI